MKQKRNLFQYKRSLRCNLIVFSIFVSSIGLYSQTTITVSGSITDVNRETIIGASISEKGTTNGTVSDINGNYSLNVANNSTLVISYIGYISQEIRVSGRTNIPIVLEEDMRQLEEVVVVGYGVKKKETLTGAVSAVSGEQIITTKHENVQNMLTGKLPGVRVYEKTGEPGAFNGNFDIRGFGTPLFVIDGIISDQNAFQRLDANDIENVSILKDASASIYGIRAANGVMLVTTNRGKDTGGKITLSYTGRMGWEYPSGSPKSTTAAEWMTLRNERVMRNVNNNNTPPYSQELINEYLDGTKTSYDWWDLTMRTASPTTNHSINFSGGNNRVSFFMSGGYQYRESFLRSNSYNYERFNVRSNITANITDRLKASMNISGMMDTRNRGWESSDWVIRSMQRCPAIMPPYWNDDPNILYYGLIEGENPVAMSSADISGYRMDKIKDFTMQTTLSYEVPGIKGLTANGMFSYRYRMTDNTSFRREFDLYRESTQATVTRGAPYQLNRDFNSRPSMMYNMSLNYKNRFDAHNIGAFIAWEGSRRQGDNFYAQRDVGMDLGYLFAGNAENQIGSMSLSESNLFNKTYQSFISRFEYDFKSKYILEATFRYDGSSIWDKAGRWGLFSSILAAWRVSEENFLKNSFLNPIGLKIRASYGEMGDDGPAANYTWLMGWNYPASGGSGALTIGNNRLPAGYFFNGTYYNAVRDRGINNPDITWVTSKITNVGFDAEAWKGLLGITFEYFRRDRTDLLATRSNSIPSTLGASMPQENLNGERNWGYELELKHNNKINDIRYRIGAMVSFTRRMNLFRDMATPGNSWENWRQLNNINRYQGVHRGYRADGRFQSYEEIANSSVYYSRSTLPGDYKYQDWNGDGRISNLDEQLFALEQNATPPMYYSLNFDTEWKGIDFAMLWQGAAFAYVRYEEQLVEPMWGNDMSNALAYFLDRWKPTEVGVNPFEHTTQWIPGKFAATGAWPNGSSEHNLYSTTYLRLKTIELGYTVPTRLSRKVGVQGVRVYVNGYNLLTIKNKDLVTDPEHTSDTWGNAYPIAKTFNIGINLKF